METLRRHVGCPVVSSVSLLNNLVVVVTDHDPPRAETPGFCPGSPNECFQGLLASCSQMLQQTPDSPPSAAASIQLLRPPGSGCHLSAGAVSASSLHPADSRDENQVRPEATLQRLFLRSEEGAPVCVLQDQPQTQAEAGMKLLAE